MFGTVLVAILLFCFCDVGISYSQENVSLPNDEGQNLYPVWSNTAETLAVEFNREKGTLWVFTNSTAKTASNKGFFYTRFPVMKCGGSFFDPKTKTINFSVELVDLPTLGNNYEVELRQRVAGFLADKNAAFQLSPIPVMGYTVKVVADHKEEVVYSTDEPNFGSSLRVTGKIVDDYICDRLEKSPDGVWIDFKVYYKFQVLKVETILGTISTTMKDEAIEKVLGRKPANTGDLFVSRDILQNLSRAIKSSIEVQYPKNMPKQLEEQLKKMEDSILRIPPITQEELESISKENVYFVPGQFRFEIEPTVISNVITSLKEGESLKNLAEKSWKSLHTIAKESDSKEKFYEEVQRKMKNDTAASGGGDFLGLIKANVSGSFSFDGEWDNKSASEKEKIEKFFLDIKSDKYSKDEYERDVFKHITGSMGLKEVQAKDFDLHRISVAELLREISLALSEVEKMPAINMPYRYDLTLGNIAITPPPVPAGTVIFLASSEIPEGYLFCDGRVLDGNDPKYQKLYKMLGDSWGTPSDDEKQGKEKPFKIPDLRNMFLRSAASASEIAQKENWTTALPKVPFVISESGGHTHTMSGAGAHSHANGEYNQILKTAKQEKNSNSCDDFGGADGQKPDVYRTATISPIGNHSHTIQNSPAHRHALSGGDNETRPVNVRLAAYIKM